MHTRPQPAELLECRLYSDPAAAGAWNMAADEVLLGEGEEAGTASLRFYRWAEPTLSLGYFQNYADRLVHSASRDVAVVRRMSGGGAILHDQEITYSLVIPAAHRPSRTTSWLYDAVHDALIAVLSEQGFAASRWRSDAANPIHTEAPAAGGQSQPFLCFQRRAAGDVVSGQVKICGSAQRRRGGLLLQHGSLLLRASAAAPELPGLCELGTGKLDEPLLVARWQAELASRLGLRWLPAEWSPRQRQQATRLVTQKYASSAWSERR